jgi:hypothetical protein
MNRVNEKPPQDYGLIHSKGAYVVAKYKIHICDSRLGGPRPYVHAKNNGRALYYTTLHTGAAATTTRLKYLRLCFARAVSGDDNESTTHVDVAGSSCSYKYSRWRLAFLLFWFCEYLSRTYVAGQRHHHILARISPIQTPSFSLRDRIPSQLAASCLLTGTCNRARSYV